MIQFSLRLLSLVNAQSISMVKVLGVMCHDIVPINWVFGCIRIVGKLMDKVRRIQELRRSGATTPMRNKKKYNRKQKHKGDALK